jgi:hypothetical protein
MRWRCNFKGLSQDVEWADFSKKSVSSLSFMTTYRISLISARSISLDSNFKWFFCCWVFFLLPGSRPYPLARPSWKTVLPSITEPCPSFKLGSMKLRGLLQLFPSHVLHWLLLPQSCCRSPKNCGNGRKVLDLIDSYLVRVFLLLSWNF